MARLLATAYYTYYSGNNKLGFIFALCVIFVSLCIYFLTLFGVRAFLTASVMP